MANNTEDVELREAILGLLHKTESCTGCKDHCKKPHKCDMDLASPRCAKRVRGIERLIQQEVNRQKLELLDKIESLDDGGNDSFILGDILKLTEAERKQLKGER